MVEVIVRNLEKIEKDETEIWKVKKLFRLRDKKPMEDTSVEEVLIVFNILETKEIVEYVKNVIADDVFTNKRA